MLRSTSVKIAVIVLFSLLLGYYDLPNQFQLIPGTPQSFADSRVHLGLDLQGGSQLDYKIDLRKVAQKDQKAIVEGVRNVINRRVNALGVAEPNIYTSSIGDEQHIIVELAGIKDLEEAKRAVGKTIQLEFKEKRDQEDPKYKENVKKIADSILRKVLAAGSNFDVIAQEESQISPGKVKFFENAWKFAGEIADSGLAAEIMKTNPGRVIPKVLEGTEGYTFQDGQLVPLQGFFIVKVLDKRETASLPSEEKALEVSHILISYRGAERATDTVTRSKEEAQTEAEDVLKRLREGADFNSLAKELSDEPGANESAGKLNAAVRKDRAYDENFTDAALKLSQKGQLSEVTETPFGFHIIRADNFTQVKYNEIFLSTAADPWKDTALTGQYFEHADVTFDDLMQPIVSITFDEEGAKLFEQITERNVNKPIAIFVGGDLVSAPNVNEKISGGKAVITGRFTAKEAQELARDLNTGAIPAPVVLSGQYTIGATLGEEALQKSVKAGIIGVILLALFMILYYRLPGIIAVIALGIYTIILTFLIKSELPLSLSITLAIAIFGAVTYTILKSREGGWEKFVTFVLACFVLFFVSFLLSNAVVLTLAGVAGVILSIGMAVDANILIFERTKEELRAGRPLSSAIDVGFDRAWSSIRDSNFSSLITCAILFYFGTSIIQGFAFNLAAGILVSMFTAITITKTILKAVMRTRLGEKLQLWGYNGKPKEQKNYRIIERMKIWFGVSGAVIAVCLVALAVFGLKLGIDFKGGTLLDVSFSRAVTTEEIKNELKEIQKTVNKGAPSQTPVPSENASLQSSQEMIDLENARVVDAGNSMTYLINLPHIDNETHDAILAKFSEKFGTVTENKFTTIGPVVGETLKKRAALAVILAMAAIILYIAFAFRRVPKRVSPWKFGICAIVALLHDVMIPIGVFAILKLEVDALFITAILTVLGFSVHDTIVVFDRIRENLKYQGRDESFDQVANKSMSQTVARSINTSLTVFITLMSLLIFGSASIFNFILVLVIGIVVGTYSSIFIASPLLALWLKKSQ